MALEPEVVRTLALMAGVTNLFSFGIIAIFVLYAQDVLGVDEAGFGLLLAAMGVGGLLGAVVTSRLVPRLGPGNTLRMSLILEVIAATAFGWVTSPWVAGLLMFGFGFLITSWNVVAVSLRQSLTPDTNRGRVAGASRLLAWGTQPIGALLGGVVASWFGLTAPFFVAGAAFFIATLAVWGVISNQAIAGARAEVAA